MRLLAVEQKDKECTLWRHRAVTYFARTCYLTTDSISGFPFSFHMCKWQKYLQWYFLLITDLFAICEIAGNLFVSIFQGY